MWARRILRDMNKHFFWAGLFVVVCTGSLMAQITPAQQAGLDLGSDLNYAIIALGSGGESGNTPNFNWNSGPVNGDVLMGQGEKASFSGGGNGGLTAGHMLYYDNTVTNTGTFTSLQTPPPSSQVSTSVTQNAATIAEGVSNYAASLAPTQTFGTITTTTIITGNGGLNVIDMTGLHDSDLTLSGNANDWFVFNITGQLHTNQQMFLQGNINPAHIIFNMLGTGTVVFQTAGGDLSYGIFLATNGGSFQFSNLNLTGELINVGGDVQFVSGSKIPGTVPEPGSLALVVMGGLGVLGVALKNGGLGRRTVGSGPTFEHAKNNLQWHTNFIDDANQL